MRPIRTSVPPSGRSAPPPRLFLLPGGVSALAARPDEPLQDLLHRAARVCRVPVADLFLTTSGGRSATRGHLPAAAASGALHFSVRHLGGGCGCSRTTSDPALTPWEVQGGEELEPPISSGAVALIDARWLIGLAEDGGVLPPRQALPPAALLTLPQLKASAGLQAQLPIVCISHPWLAQDHPDPDGVCLRKIGRALRLLVENDPLHGTHAVFHSFCSLHEPCRNKEGVSRPSIFPHADGNGGGGGGGGGDGADDAAPAGWADNAIGRTASEEALYSEATWWIGALFSHPRTIVFLIPDAPAESSQEGETPSPAGAAPHSPAVPSIYLSQAWCAVEAALAFLVKETSMVLDLSTASADPPQLTDPVEALQALPTVDTLCATVRGLAAEPALARIAEGFAKVVAHDQQLPSHWYDLVARCRPSRAPPLPPDDFEAALATASFPHGHHDRQRVAEIYRRTFSSRLSAATELSYNRIGWGDAEALLVASVLQSGATPRLRELDLSFNTIGDSGAKAIAAALPHAPQVERLDLSDNRIGDAGAAALANALLRSPSVAWLNLHTNLIGDQGALALANVLPRATQLLWLNLHSNTDINGPALERLWHQANVIRKATTRPFRLLAPGRDKASFRFEPAPEDEPAAAASGDSSDKGGSRA